MGKVKYKIGSTINNKWVIVSILEIKKQNKKLLCFNLNTFRFTEGWIWDFTRDLIDDDKSTTNPKCRLSKNIHPVGKTLDLHNYYAYQVYLRQNHLSREDFFILKDFRQGFYGDVSYMLKKFDLLLISGQARRNGPLSNLIALTYIVLAERKYFTRKEVA